jgi:glycosyltransferase involved in cell wall biosynthesis
MESLVSVIVPVYNVEQYLDRCLRSIVEQSYKSLEIIIVNDGSKDDSEEICLEYQRQDARVKYYVQENSGVSAARNTGLKYATGEYVTFVDSDDYLGKDSLLEAVKAIRSENADMLMLEVTVLYRDKMEYVPHKEREGLSDGEIKHKLLLDELSNWPHTKLFKRSLWEKLRFPKGLIYEDLFIIPYLVQEARKIIMG